MSRLFSILLLLFVVVSCGGNGAKKSKAIAAVSQQKEYVEVLYFHGKQRCITCKAIEDLTKEVINTNFAEELKNGNVIFRTIDISTTDGEEIANKYEVTWSSLFINKWSNGNENRNNMTDFGFSYAKGSPDLFKDSLKVKISEQLN